MTFVYVKILVINKGKFIYSFVEDHCVHGGLFHSSVALSSLFQYLADVSGVYAIPEFPVLLLYDVTWEHERFSV